MENKNSTSGIGEDIIRSIAQLGSAEMHLKTLIEKSDAELANGMVDVENPEELNAHLDKLRAYTEEIIEVAQLRRETMLYLYDMYRGDKDMWCMVKHLAIANMTIFEAWQASDNDPALYDLAIRTNKSFVKAITRFIGAEVTDCASCLSDMLKAKGEK